MADPKDTVYIDVDEEITSIVSKVQASNKSIVALVLPKRASVLQSIVNMKLLKRAADQNDKQVVLITNEHRLFPLAGVAKVFVAPNLTSKPYIPPSPALDEPAESAEVVTLDPKTPVSEAAPDAKFADEETLQIDNTSKTVPETASNDTRKKKAGKKIPNFGSFRKKMIIGAIAGLLLLFGLIYALVFAPKAHITLKTQSDDVAAQFDFVADPNTTEFKQADKIVPAQQKEVEKNDSETVKATGEKDVGKKASGTVTLRNCSKSVGEITIPAGSGVSSDEYTFITQQAVTLPSSTFNGNGDCVPLEEKDVAVVAQDPGDDYNLSPRRYTVAGRSGITGVGSEMKGGTSKKIKVVSQKDIDSAKERLNSKQNSVRAEMAKEFDDNGFVGIAESFKPAPANYNPSPAVNSEAEEVTVSVTTKYTMLGVKKDDLKKLIEEDVKDEKTGNQQTLLDDGIAKAKFNISTAIGQLEEGQVRLNFQTTVVIGPEINQEELARELAGKRKGPAEDLLKQRPGILEPQVKLSPFWVSSVPKKASKVTFEIQQADGQQINSSE